MNAISEIKDGILEIRWHGRGGQGAVSSAQILAQAAYRGGYKGVTSAPTFGAERRGAPVSASTRLSLAPLRIFSQIEQPDVVIVLDDTLLGYGMPIVGLSEGGWLIVNTHRRPEELEYNGRFKVATVDATQVAQEMGLVVAGSVIVNTAMLGAFAKATRLVTMENINQAIFEKYPVPLAKKNAKAAQATYERTIV